MLELYLFVTCNHQLAVDTWGQPKSNVGILWGAISYVKFKIKNIVYFVIIICKLHAPPSLNL